MNTSLTSAISTLVACFFLVPGIGQAQSAGDARDHQVARPQQAHSLVLEPVKSGWVIAPDVQVTKVDNLTRALIGAYGGWQVDGRLLLGAGGYWLTDRAGEVGMSYGGAVVGWTMPLGERLAVDARALVGGGEAAVPGVVAFGVPVDSDSNHDQFHRPGLDGFRFPRQFRFRQGFGIAQPQAGVVLHITRWMALDASGGYRFVGWARGVQDQLRGGVGSVSVRLGAGS